MLNSQVKATIAAVSIVSTLMTSACATANKPNTAYTIADPIEPLNRGIFKFNDVVDKIIIEPIAKAYKAVVPNAARSSVQSFMRNLKTPLTLANNLLQGDMNGAGVTTARFLVNTTLGVGGLFDIAEKQGYSYKEEDFGQTLATWGVGDGFYLVLPILGPSSLRDTAGLVTDTIADPVRIAAHNHDEDWIYYTRNIIQGVDNRARLIDGIDDLRKNSLDYYAAMRSAYGQRRQSLIYNENPDSKAEAAQTNYEDFEDSK